MLCYAVYLSLIHIYQYHFYAMGSGWDTLEKADGKKIFVWHLNGTEDLPCGAYYNNDEKRMRCV